MITPSTPASPSAYVFGHARDRGHSAKILMDACGGYASPEGSGVMIALADGMGGHAGGEVASRIAVDTALEIFGVDGFGDPGSTVRRVFPAVNERLQEARVQDPSLQSMGTTLVVAAVANGRLSVAHVGDSRATLYRGEYGMRLTRDHLSVVEREGANDAGVKSDPRYASRANVLSRYLGGPQVEPEVRQEYVERGDWIFLASDGITEYVLEDEISRILRAYSPQAAADLVVRRAVENKSHDHCSAVVLAVP